MNVRMTKPSTGSSAGPTAHRSFRLTKPLKAKLMQKGFGQYTPEAFRKDIQQRHDPKTITKEQEYFLRHAGSEKTLTTKEDIKKFGRGFLEEAHAEGSKLRSGYNPPGHEREQAERLIKEFEKQQTPPAAKTPTPREQQREHRAQLRAVRERLGVQHGGGASPAAIIEPTPIGNSGWSGQRAGWGAPTGGPPEIGSADAPRTPSLGPAMIGFTGGRITTTAGRPDNSSYLRPPGTEPGPVVPGNATPIRSNEPSQRLNESESMGSQPPSGTLETSATVGTPPPPAPAAESQPPDPSSVHELPI